MKFKISFTNSKHCVIGKESIETGLKHIDFIREKTEKNLLLDKINYTTDRLYINPCITIDEETARKCGSLFDEINHLCVTTAKGHLDKFVKDKINITKDEGTGEIREAKIAYYCDKEEIIKAWIEEGCPVEWGNF